MLFKTVSVALLGFIIWRTYEMNAAFQKAKDDLLAEVADSQGKLASIQTYLEGLPELVATAVQTALENADVEATAAAAEIDAARQSISDSVDQTLGAINANPAPGEDTGGGDTTGGGTTGEDTGTGEAPTGDNTTEGGTEPTR